MATSNPLVALGVLDIAPGKPLSSLNPKHVGQPPNKDHFGARELLVHLRTLDPSYKAPKEQKRSFLPSKKKTKDLDDPSSWSFSNAEVGRAITFALRKNVPGVVSIVAALLAMGAEQGASAQQLWSCEQGHGQKAGPSILKFIRLQKSTSTTETPCPWLQIAAEMDSLPLVHLLSGAGLSQKTLDHALETAIQTGIDPRVEKELVALGADFPDDPGFLVTVMSSTSSHRALRVTELLLSTHHPCKHPAALAAMKRAAMTMPTDKDLQETLSTLLANVILGPLELYEVLLAAIEGQNLSAVAAVSLAAGHDWKHIVETGGSEATTLAAHIDDPDIRFRLLGFLELVGATPDTPALRDRLLQDAKSGNIEGLDQLLLFGVSPACPTTHSDTGTLGWAVQSLSLDIFNLILATAKFTPQAASDALRLLPKRAPETTKIKIIRSLAESGASCEELSRQLFLSVRDSEPHLVDMLLDLGATSTYRNRDGESALSTAARLGNVPLVRNLLAGAPPDIVSEAMPYALAGLDDQEQALISVLKMLVSHGAHGPSVDETILKTLERPGPATEEILMVLLPVGVGPVASGKAVLALSRQAATARSLELLCEASDIPETALASALKIVLGHEPFNVEKARILGETIKATDRCHILDHMLVHFHRDAEGKGHQIVDFLLASGASIDAGDGCAMAAEASRGNLVRLRDMMRRSPSPLTLENTLKKALSLLPGPVQRDIVRLILDSATTDIGQGDVALLAVQDEDTDLLKLVMNHSRGRVPFSCEEALWDAIDHDNDKAVSILVQNGITPEIAASALDHLLGGPSLETPKAVNIATSLLQVEVDPGTKDAALSKAFSAVSASGALPVELIHLLVSKGADPCQQAALLFRTTFQKADIAALRALTAAPFPLDRVVRILMESSDDSGASYVAKALNICLAQAKRYSSQHELEDNTLLKVALERYPTSDAIVALLLDNGCTASADCGLQGPNGTKSLPIFWASNPARRVPDKVMLKLLSATSKQELRGIPPSDMVCVMHAAAARKDPTLFKQLISRGVTIDLETSHGDTALSLATYDDDLVAIKALTGAGSRRNDGSLHIAASQLNARSIKLLRDSGHEVSWPCPRFGFQIPLASLVCVEREPGKINQRALEDALESLTPFPEAKCQEGEKSALHHILDHPTCPVQILQAYARAARLHEQPSKDDYYLFKDPLSKLCFSPPMYVWYRSPATRSQETRVELFNILRSLSFRDRYYAESGPQPDGYTMEAVPQAVKFAMERDRDSEQDRRRLEEHRRYLDQESERRRIRADADEARDLRAMATRADAQIAIEQRIAHARLAGARENWFYEQSRAQYVAPLRVSEPESRGRPSYRNYPRTRPRVGNREVHRVEGSGRSAARQTASSSQGADYSWPQHSGWSYMPSAPSSSSVPRSRNHPPTGYVIGPVDENGYVHGYNY